MKLKKLLAVALAAAISFSGSVSAFAATATKEEKMPDLIFYRSKARETFDGEISLPGKGTITDAQTAGDSPAFSVSSFEGSSIQFEALYKSTEQPLTVTRDGKTEEHTAAAAVYDRVQLIGDKGSVTLTVKDNKTLKPVPGAEYSLYQGSHRVQDGLVSDASGKVTVTGLLPGAYELRPLNNITGYLATSASIPFTIGGLELSGGDISIRTSAGKKITADENEILIAGEFSPDIELTATKSDHLSEITVELENYGATLDSAGKTVSKSFSSAREAAEYLNAEKNAWNICGAVEIRYTLKISPGKSTCNYIQYLEAKPVSQVTPTPTPGSGNQNQGSGTQTPIVSATPTPQPTATPAPQVTPYGTVTIAAECKGKPMPGVTMELIGKTSAGTGVDKVYLTDSEGMIFIDKVPEGTYTLSVVETEATDLYDIPYTQNINVGAGSACYQRVSFSKLTGSISGVVTDTDGEPLRNITVGLYSVSDRMEQEDLSGKVKSKDEKEDISGKTYYNAANAAAVAVSDLDGEFTFTRVEVGDYELMPLVTGGYFAPEQPATCTLAQNDVTDAQVTVESTRVSILYLGKNGGKLTGRTVMLDDPLRTTWVTARDPVILKGLIPGEYTATVQSEEGKEDIEPYTFTVEDSPEEQAIEIQTDAKIGETDIPSAEPEEKPEEKQPEKQENKLPIIGIIACCVLICGAAGFIIYRYIKKRKPEKGGMK